MTARSALLGPRPAPWPRGRAPPPAAGPCGSTGRAAPSAARCGTAEGSGGGGGGGGSGTIENILSFRYFLGERAGHWQALGVRATRLAATVTVTQSPKANKRGLVHGTCACRSTAARRDRERPRSRAAAARGHSLRLPQLIKGARAARRRFLRPARRRFSRRGPHPWHVSLAAARRWWRRDRVTARLPSPWSGAARGTTASLSPPPL